MIVGQEQSIGLCITCTTHQSGSPLDIYLYWLQTPVFGSIKITYILIMPDYIDDTTKIMLSLNKDFREEVAFIFYGASNSNP